MKRSLLNDDTLCFIYKGKSCGRRNDNYVQVENERKKRTHESDNSFVFAYVLRNNKTKPDIKQKEKKKKTQKSTH